MKSFLIMMAVRLLEMRRFLKSTGSIYLHCDDTASRYLKTLMDSVFGPARFLLLFNHLWMERTTTSAAAAKIIQQSQTEARRYLSRLVEHGLVESRGRGRGASYQLSSATYRRLGLEHQYVRQRGFEPLQQDQLVLQYVAAHGPRCGGLDPYECSHAKMPYRCRDCGKYFSVKPGTLMSGSPLPLRAWAFAVLSGRHVPSTQLARDLGVSQKTAWFIQGRIR